MKSLLVLAPVALVLALVAPVQAQSLDEVRDQGILYFKKDLYKPAQEQLDKAFKMKGGQGDFMTVYYRAQTHYKVLRLETAFEMIVLAHKLAEGDDKRLQRVKELEAEMKGLYGGVTLKPAKDAKAKRGRITFEAKTGIINKEKKERFLSIRERFRSTDVELPATVYLPYGEYLANNAPFAVTAEDVALPEVEVFLEAVVDEREEEGMSGWWWVGIGGGVVAAAGVTALILLSGGGEQPPGQTRFTFELMGR